MPGSTLDGSGNLYIASLFGEGVYRVPAGSTAPALFLPAALAADVAVKGSTLFATTNVFGDGTLVSVALNG